MIRLDGFQHPSGATYFNTPILLIFHKAAFLFTLFNLHPFYFATVLTGHYASISTSYTLNCRDNSILLSYTSKLLILQNLSIPSSKCFGFFYFFSLTVLYQQKSLLNTRNMISICSNCVGQSLSITYVTSHYSILTLNNNLFLYLPNDFS